MFQPKGIVTSLVTCFTADDGLDLDAMRASVRYQIGEGVHGVCPLGGTGEPLSQTLDEHKAVIDAVVGEAAGRIQVIVGCLRASPAEIVEVGRYAKAAGADAIMVIAPYFYGASLGHIKQHFVDIANKVDMPMVLFNGPTRAGIRLPVDFVLELIEAAPQFVAIKEATGDISLVTELVRRAPPHFAVLQGYDELIYPTLALGGRGALVSLGCLVPRTLVALYDAFGAGDFARARDLQLAIMPLAELIYLETNPGPLKTALAMVGRSAGPCRPPILPTADETRTKLERLLPRFACGGEPMPATVHG